MCVCVCVCRGVTSSSIAADVAASDSDFTVGMSVYFPAHSSSTALQIGTLTLAVEYLVFESLGLCESVCLSQFLSLCMDVISRAWPLYCHYCSVFNDCISQSGTAISSIHPFAIATKPVHRLQIHPILHNKGAPHTVPQSYIWVCVVV